MDSSSLASSGSGARGAPCGGAAQVDAVAAAQSLYRAILVAADCSDHSNRGVSEAVTLAGLTGARITGIHAYAARLHDMRFRQMEGGLPERYRQEAVLEQQRDIHNELIARGLTVIADSYLDQAALACCEASIPFTPCTVEGKNYRELLNETNSGRHDLLVIGAQGLGAVPGSSLGTVCERVARRTAIDTLVIKDPQRRLDEGPIVVAIDGSDHSYGGLATALALAQGWGVQLQVVAAYDPYFHYVAFNRISRVLSEEASRTFRFKEQERLHEEVIDAGLARIYQGHLNVARSIAAERGMTIETLLLDGKPHAAIEKHLSAARPSLLVIGKLGIHADADLDIGGNAERLLRNVECAVLLSRRTHRPPLDTVAAVTTTWTAEAERRMERVPEFARKMARMAILQYAQERGHTVITERIVDDATDVLCPGHARKTTGAQTNAGAGNENPGTGAS
jgi:nucleotide-binding universal stress UspA family protein